jgi:hypothetical protein
MPAEEQNVVEKNSENWNLDPPMVNLNNSEN